MTHTAATAPSIRAPRPRQQSHDDSSTHTVRRGETLDAIARRAGVSLQQLIEANPQISNPHEINPGQKVHLPHAERSTRGRSSGRTAERQAELDAAPTTRTRRNNIPAGETRRGAPKGASTAPRTNTTERTAERTPQTGAPPNGTARFDSVSRAGQRNQMMTGQLTVNGNTYTFRSGGHGRGNLPEGDYTVTAHMQNRSDRSMSVGGVGYSFAVSDKYDPRVRANRSLLRIHPDGGTAGTEGCIGIVGDADTQRRFRADMNAELRRNNGRFTLHVRD